MASNRSRQASPGLGSSMASNSSSPGVGCRSGSSRIWSHSGFHQRSMAATASAGSHFAHSALLTDVPCGHTLRMTPRAHYGRLMTAAVLLALACSVAYGAADFLGGLAARGAHVLLVVVIAAPVSLLVELLLWPVAGASFVPGAVTWGAASGLASAAAFA